MSRSEDWKRVLEAWGPVFEREYGSGNVRFRTRQTASCAGPGRFSVAESLGSITRRKRFDERRRTGPDQHKTRSLVRCLLPAACYLSRFARLTPLRQNRYDSRQSAQRADGDYRIATAIVSEHLTIVRRARWLLTPTSVASSPRSHRQPARTPPRSSSTAAEIHLPCARTVPLPPESPRPSPTPPALVHAAA